MTAIAFKGDARQLPLPDDSVHAIICDTPYELGFMGKKWDSTGVAYDPDTWREAHRVLAPGGHVLAFGGTRTWHRLAVAIEDAGFELRDNIAWLHGQGFPKSKFQLKPGFEPIAVARKPPVGSVAANVLTHGTGALNIDACKVGPDVDTCRPKGRNPSKSSAFPRSDDARVPHLTHTGMETGGRWPTNVVLSHQPLLDDGGEVIGDACADGCVEGCPVAELDAQSGITKSSGGAGAASARTKNGNTYGEYTEPVAGSWSSAGGLGDVGGASRFFPTFRYQAKAPTKERPKVDGKAHPTVKPLGLMRWLVRLATPPGGLLLDQFAGSGATVEAAVIEGVDVIGVDLDEDGHYIPMIRQRIARATAAVTT
jgi:DNA modification methylase